MFLTAAEFIFNVFSLEKYSIPYVVLLTFLSTCYR